MLQRSFPNHGPLFAADEEYPTGSSTEASQVPVEIQSGETPGINASPTGTSPDTHEFNSATSHFDAERADEATQPESPSAAAIRAQKIRENASRRWQEASERAREINTTARERFREHPTTAMISALGLGILMGLAARR
jgi:ElaB/YqjD/DUF883 family membrane-anchored ribosome-binding protein